MSAHFSAIEASRDLRPGTGLILIHGDPACLTVGLLLGLRAAAPASPLLIVDGANALDPYMLSGLARRLKQRPEALLASVFISRVFTAYQLEAAVVERLEGAVVARRACGILLAGLLDPLHDEDLSATEARRIFRRVITALTRLAAQPYPLVVAAPFHPPVRGREGFGVQLAAASEWVFHVASCEGRIEITGEKPSPGRWCWDPEVPLLAARRWY